MSAALSAAVMAVLALVLAGPVPRALERSTALAHRPRLLLVSWSGWGVVSALVLIGCCAVGGACLGRFLDLDRQLGAGVGSALLAAVAAAVATAWLLVASTVVLVRIGRSRRRHRAAVELVGSFDYRLPAWVLDDARPLAYTIPGPREPVVVVTRGALALTDRAELLAVLSHERQHGRRVSSMLLTAWAVWAQVWPTRSLGRRVLPAVEVATEMIADDAARTVVGPQATIAAICRLQTGLPAACDEFGWEPDPATLRRVRRLLAAQAA